MLLSAYKVLYIMAGDFSIHVKFVECVSGCIVICVSDFIYAILTVVI